MKTLLSVVLTIVLSAASFTTRSDSAVGYLDGSLHMAWYLGNGVATIFWDVPGDRDIFTHHINGIGNPVLMTMEGKTLAYCYWLDYKGTSGSYMVFDLYGDSGGGWVYLGTMYL